MIDLLSKFSNIPVVVRHHPDLESYGQTEKYLTNRLFEGANKKRFIHTYTDEHFQEAIKSLSINSVYELQYITYNGSICTELASQGIRAISLMNNLCGNNLSRVIQSKAELEDMIKTNFEKHDNTINLYKMKIASLMLKFNRKSCIDSQQSPYGKYLKNLDMDGYHFGIKNNRKINIIKTLEDLDSISKCYLFEDKACKIISYR